MTRPVLNSLRLLDTLALILSEIEADDFVAEAFSCDILRDSAHRDRDRRGGRSLYPARVVHVWPWLGGRSELRVRHLCALPRERAPHQRELRLQSIH
jgi:hypothetical protein